MKKIQIAGFTALTLLGSLTAVQAQSATTAPVGYVTLASVDNPIPANTDVRLSVPMEASVDFTGLAVSAAGSTLTVSGTSFTTDQFTPDTGGYYLRIKNGDSLGLTAEILSHTDDTLTLGLETGDNLDDVDGTTQIEIVKYFTLSTFFPSSLPSGTEVHFFNNTNGINKSANTIVSWDGEKWVEGFSTVDATLYPGESFIIRTAGTAVTDLIITGNVPTVSHRLKLESIDGNQQDMSVSYLSPVPEVIATSGLGFTSGDELHIFDRRVGINKSASQILSYNGTSWMDGFTDVSNTFKLEPGMGYILRRATVTPGSTEWKNTQTYNQANN